MGLGLDVDVRAGKSGQHEDQGEEDTKFFHEDLLFWGQTIHSVKEETL
jgi:hypothetical protein